jgi:hypothetical protein
MVMAPSGTRPVAGKGISSPPNSCSPWVRTSDTLRVFGGKLENLKAGDLESVRQDGTPAQEKVNSGLLRLESLRGSFGGELPGGYIVS